MNKSETIGTAARILEIPVEDAQKNAKYLPNYNAVYFWNPIRGGAAIIIEPNGSFLYAISSVGFDDHLKAFLRGERSDPGDFIDI